MLCRSEVAICESSNAVQNFSVPGRAAETWCKLPTHQGSVHFASLLVRSPLTPNSSAVPMQVGEERRAPSPTTILIIPKV